MGFKCPFCKFVTNFFSSRNQHIRTHTKERPFKCQHLNCNASYGSASTLREHQQSHIDKTDDSKLFKCSKCPFKTVYKANLNAHFRTHSDVKQFSCDLCPFQTNHKPNRTKHHNARHLQLKPFKCPELNCNYAAIAEPTLNTHRINRHMNEEERDKFLKFKCLECPFKTAIKRSLKNHLMTHSDEKPFSCDLCPYRAKTKSSLKIHGKFTHSTEKPFKCSQPNCNYSAKQKGMVVRHMRVHSNDKPLVCSFPGCLYKTKWETTLKSHETVHDGRDKPFKCSFCSFTCRQREGLTVHTRRHLGEAPYSCPYCPYRSKDCSSVARHRKTCKFSKNQGRPVNSSGAKTFVWESASIQCKMAGCDFVTTQHSSVATHYNTVHNLPRVYVTKLNP